MLGIHYVPNRSGALPLRDVVHLPLSRLSLDRHDPVTNHSDSADAFPPDLLALHTADFLDRRVLQRLLQTESRILLGSQPLFPRAPRLTRRVPHRAQLQRLGIERVTLALQKHLR